jgi:hypothetical protein
MTPTPQDVRCKPVHLDLTAPGHEQTFGYLSTSKKPLRGGAFDRALFGQISVWRERTIWYALCSERTEMTGTSVDESKC